jgi:ornithine cyclodeaminase
MLVINHSQVRELLPMKDCMEVVGAALSALARGEGAQPLRKGFRLPGRNGVMAWMPGALSSGQPFGIKILSVIDNADELGVGSHQGGVLIFDPVNGSPIALCEADALTAVRTAAVSALATERLARRDATTLAVLGAGTQARSHIEAMLAVRPIEQVRMWNRTRATAEKVAEDCSERHGVSVDVMDGVASAVADADIVCTTTSSRDPFFLPELLGPGMHINAVGASAPTWFEIDAGVLPMVTLFTDRRESLSNEAGEYIEAVKTGLIPAGLVVPEIGEVLNGDHPGRTSETEITLFRSLGLAVEDIASAQLVYRRAVERGIGTEVDMGC